MVLLRWVALAVFVTDQLVKLLIMAFLPPGSADLPVLEPLLVLRPGLNTGVNFGLFDGGQGLVQLGLAAVAAGISVALWIWARRSFEFQSEFASAGLLIGGALGNALDRLVYGGVVDFLNMSCCGIRNPFIFNLADVAIFAGVLGLALFTGHKDEFSPRRQQRLRDRFDAWRNKRDDAPRPGA